MFEKLKNYWKLIGAATGGGLITIWQGITGGGEEAVAAGLATVLSSLFVFFFPKNKE